MQRFTDGFETYFCPSLMKEQRACWVSHLINAKLKLVNTQSFELDSMFSSVNFMMILRRYIFLHERPSLSSNNEAVKLAIGVPVHTNTNKSYAEAGMISLRTM